jgi:hypothetical protein
MAQSSSREANSYLASQEILPKIHYRFHNNTVYDHNILWQHTAVQVRWRWRQQVPPKRLNFFFQRCSALKPRSLYSAIHREISLWYTSSAYWQISCHDVTTESHWATCTTETHDMRPKMQRDKRKSDTVVLLDFKTCHVPGCASVI